MGKKLASEKFLDELYSELLRESHGTEFVLPFPAFCRVSSEWDDFGSRQELMEYKDKMFSFKIFGLTWLLAVGVSCGNTKTKKFLKDMVIVCLPNGGKKKRRAVLERLNNTPHFAMRFVCVRPSGELEMRSGNFSEMSLDMQPVEQKSVKEVVQYFSTLLAETCS